MAHSSLAPCASYQKPSIPKRERHAVLLRRRTLLSSSDRLYLGCCGHKKIFTPQINGRIQACTHGLPTPMWKATTIADCG